MDGATEPADDEAGPSDHGPRRPPSGRRGLRRVAIASLVLATLSAAATGWWWHRQREAQREAELTRTFQRTMAAVLRGEAPLDDKAAGALFPETPLGSIYRRVLRDRQESMALVERLLARYRDERDAWAALATAEPDAGWRAARIGGTRELRAGLDRYQALLAAMGRFLDESAGYDEWTREAARKLRPDRTSPAELELRAALREVCLAWDDRLAVLARPSTGSEDDRSERQRLADRQATLTERVELALRALRSEEPNGSR